MEKHISTRIAKFCTKVLKGTTQFAYNKQRNNFHKYSESSGFSEKTLNHIYKNILQLEPTENSYYEEE